MESTISIIARKKAGIDCTEEESAEIKGFMRSLISRCTTMEQTNQVIYDNEVFELFPIECSEVMCEFDHGVI